MAGTPARPARRYRVALRLAGVTAAYFPGRRRHDLEALTCYSAYKRSRDAVSETGQPATGATAVRKWEDEGGATLPPDGP